MKKIISWNVNGIRAVIKKGDFQNFIKTHQPDVLCLQETKASKDQVEIDLPNYHEYWNSADKKGYSGTAIFSKEEPINVFYGFTDNGTDFADAYGDASREGRVTTAEFKDYFVVTVYTPNTKRDLSRLKFRHEIWDVVFLKHVKDLEKKKPVIFCGDLNVAHKEIDLARPQDNIGEHGFTEEERKGFQNFIDEGFVDTFRIFYPDKPEEYSWWTHWANARKRNIGWRIDYFLVSDQLKNKVKEAFILQEVMGSDHAPVGVVIE
jgi:exodeoxyribonuclease-3